MGDKDRASRPKNLDYSKEEVHLPFSKELLDELKSEATRALKMQSCDRLTDPYNHLERFTYVGYSQPPSNEQLGIGSNRLPNDPLRHSQG